MVVGWSSYLWKHKKQLRKHKKKEEKTRKTIYYLNNEKTMKTSFYCFKKNGFWEYKKYKKQKHTPFPKQNFYIFCFHEYKTVLENKNQTCPIPKIEFFFPFFFNGMEEKIEKIYI